MKRVMIALACVATFLFAYAGASAVEELWSLRRFERQDPVQEAQAAIARGDNRLLLGDYGWGANAVGLEPTDSNYRRLLEKHGTRLAIRMSDDMASDRQLKLGKVSEVYLARYNATILASRPPPDLRDILFQAQRQGGTEDIYALQVLDLAARRLVVADTLSSRALPAWSPDSRSIVFVREFADSGQLYILDSLQATPRRIAEELRGFFAFPDWSPDGTQVLFTAGTDPAHPAVYVIQRDGSGLRTVLKDSLAYRCPSWAPDGRRFSVSAYASGRSQIQVVDLRTSARRTVLAPDTAYVDCPQWSPRGDEVLLTVYRGTTGLYEERPRRYGSNLATLGLQNLRFAALTDGRGLNNYGRWSQDGRWIVFQSDRHVLRLPDSTGTAPPFDSLEIYTVRADGSELQRLTRNDYFDAHPSW